MLRSQPTQLRNSCRLKQKKVADTLGVPSDLIPTLTPGIIPIDQQLGRVLARGSLPQATVAATVLFARHAVAAKAGISEWLQASREAAEAAMLVGSQHPGLARALAAQMDKVTATRRPSPSHFDGKIHSP